VKKEEEVYTQCLIASGERRKVGSYEANEDKDEKNARRHTPSTKSIG
jgi:hypothetical protein